MNGFQNTGPVLNETWDFRNFVLKESLRYLAKDGRLYRAPEGTTTDLLSVPPPAWFEIAPFGHWDGKEWIGAKSGIMHDAGYRGTLEVQTHGGNWIKAKFDQSSCDDLIAEMLESEGFDSLLKDAVFQNLRAFGGRAFAVDRAELTANKPEMPLPIEAQ